MPVIIPLVLHHDEEGWKSPVSFHDLFPPELVRKATWAGLIPSFRFLLDDISGASDEELQARQMSEFARLALWALRDARFDRLERTLSAWSELFSRLLHSPGGQEATDTLFCYIYEVRGTATVQALAQKIPDPHLREAAMSIAEQLLQERQEGRQEGSLQRLREVALKLLTLKFGELDDATRAHIDAADEASLDRYTERVLSASTLEEVLKD